MAAIGSKLALTGSEIQAIQTHLYKAAAWRDLALFMVGIDSLLRSCDMIRLQVQHVQILDRTIRQRVVFQQQKTKRTTSTISMSKTKRILS